MSSVSGAIQGDLPDVLQRNVMMGALRAGANVIADEARARVPVGHGQLKASIRVSGRFKNGMVKVFVKAGSRYTVYKIGKKGRSTKEAYRSVRGSGQVDYHTAFYAHFVEFGVKPHVIVAGGGSKAGQVLASAARILGEKVDHPGAKPKPFMRPAFDTKANEAVDAVAEYLRVRLPKEIANLRR